MPSKLVQAVQNVCLLRADAVIVLHEGFFRGLCAGGLAGFAWLLMVAAGRLVAVQACAGDGSVLLGVAS